MEGYHMPLVSVVIPVYNVIDYLDRCVRSVLLQSYINLEILLVDDGSTDGSGSKCDEYLELDKRIRVLHKENGGLSDARNAGIEASKGQYICFIDSDDYVHTDYIMILYDCIINNAADIAICGYLKGKLNSFPEEHGTSKDCVVFQAERMLEQWHSKYKHVETMAWNKLYLRELFIGAGIRYPKGYNNEDVQTTHLLVAESKKVAIIEQKLYYYFQRDNSITNIRVSEKGITDNIVSQNERLKFFEQNGYTNAYERMKIKLEKYYMLMYCTIPKSNFGIQQKELLDAFKREYSFVIGCSQINMLDKCLFFLFRHCYGVVDFVYRIIN